MWSRLGRGRGKKVGGGCGWMARVAFLGDRLPSPPKFQRSKVKKKRQQQQLFWDHSAPAVCDHIWLNHLLTVRNNNVTSSSSSTTRHRQWEEEEEEACRHASFNEPLLLSLSFPTHSTDLSLPLSLFIFAFQTHITHQCIISPSINLSLNWGNRTNSASSKDRVYSFQIIKLRNGRHQMSSFLSN